MKITIESSGNIHHPTVSIELSDEASACELLKAFADLLVPLGFTQEVIRKTVVQMGLDFTDDPNPNDELFDTIAEILRKKCKGINDGCKDEEL